MSLASPSMLRQRLAGLREQRRAQRVTAEDLGDRIRTAVNEAIDAGIPVTEVAKLLDMDRSSVYRTYVEPKAA